MIFLENSVNYKTGTITGNTSSRNVHAGGIAGQNRKNSKAVESPVLTESYNAAEIYASTTSGIVRSGGIAGLNNTATISNSTAQKFNWEFLKDS